MSERVGLDYTHGVAEDIPDDTRSDIDPDRVIDLALRHVSKPETLYAGMGLVRLASLVEPTMSADLLERLETSPSAIK